MSSPDVPVLLAQYVAFDEVRPAMSQPYTVEDEGVKYTVATNGHRIIAIPGDLGFPVQESLTEKTLKILHDVPEGESVVISLPALREFLGATFPGQCSKCRNRAGSWSCDECGGAGCIPHVCNRFCEDDCDDDAEWCERCDGAGKLRCVHCTETDDYVMAVDPIRLGPCFLNRWMLVAAVRHLRGESARLVFNTDPERAVFLACDDGRVFVMPLRDMGDERFHKAPSFTVSAA